MKGCIFIIIIAISSYSCKVYLPNDFNNKVYNHHEGLINNSIQLYNDSLFLYIDDLKISEGFWEIDDKGYIVLKSFPRKTEGYYCYKFYKKQDNEYMPYQYIEFTKKVKIITKKLLKEHKKKYYLSEKKPLPDSPGSP